MSAGHRFTGRKQSKSDVSFVRSSWLLMQVSLYKNANPRALNAKSFKFSQNLYAVTSREAACNTFWFQNDHPPLVLKKYRARDTT
eukprot:6211434-Pleurochrysis_carterae.AAC.3